ncbi:MAG: hypothetical protein K2Y29_00050 [Beijerinckiaceae bacterium]|nr:hypothetical protein [Beijerinckiaceae bacterium]
MSHLPTRNTDSFQYFDMAVGILAGAPLSAFPNGYPLLIAAIALLTNWTSADQVLLALNVLFSTGTVLLVFLIALRCYGLQCALVAALLLALWPNQINYVRLLTTEAATTFILTAAIASIVAQKYALSGLLIWLSAFFRSSLLPLVALFVIVLLIKCQYRAAGVFLAGFAVGFGIEASLLFFGVIAPSSYLGPNLLLSIASDSISGINFIADPFTAEQKASPLRTYLLFALNEPAQFAWQRFAALWELWGPLASAGNEPVSRSTLARLIIGLRFPLLLAAIYGALWFRKRIETLFLLLPLVIITTIHTAFFANPRFTVPAEPCVAILAAAAIVLISNAAVARWARA